MKKIYLLGFMAASLVFNSCTRDSATVPQSDYALNGVDMEFIRLASYDNLYERDLGAYAATYSTDADIQAYGSLMASDHKMAQAELSVLVKSFRIPEITVLDAENLSRMNSVKKNTGTSFDASYMNGEVLGHREAISLYQKEIKTGNNKLLIDYANKYIIQVEEHLKAANGVAP